jgi:hypothetical protein
MRAYNSRPPNEKAWKDKNCKIRFRWFGSTHSSETKDRIVRWGRRAARRQAKDELKEWAR